MSIDLIQLAYYAGFVVLGWWLRHQGLLKAPVNPSPNVPPLPVGPIDQKALIDLLKALLDRLVQPATDSATPPAAGAVFHVPVEVAATARPPR